MTNMQTFITLKDRTTDVKKPFEGTIRPLAGIWKDDEYGLVEAKREAIRINKSGEPVDVVRVLVEVTGIFLD